MSTVKIDSKLIHKEIHMFLKSAIVIRKLHLLVAYVSLALSTFADTWLDPDTGLTWTYVMTNGEVSVGGGTYKLPALTKNVSSHVTIPKNINGHPVTSIGDFAFQCCYNLPSIDIPDGVKVIGRYAFSECYKMSPPTLPLSVTDLQEDAFDRCFAFKTISLPSSITNIGHGVFMSSGLTAIVIPEGVKSIGSQAFSFCNDLKIAYISASVETIGYGAFKQCYDLSSVVIANGVKHIGDSAFEMCEALTTFDVPGSVESIGSQAFEDCKKLTSITMREGLYEIGHEAFSGCLELREITIPSTVTILENGIFYKCDKLTSVTINAGVTTFWSNVFDHCYGLKTLVIPPSVTKLSSASFRNCPNLTSVYFRGNAPSASNPFSEMNNSLVIYVAKGTTGWNGNGSTTLPSSWYGHAIVYGEPDNAEAYTAYDVVFEKSCPPNQHWTTNTVYTMPKFKGWQSSNDGRVYPSGKAVMNIANAGEKVFMVPIWDAPKQISNVDSGTVVVAMTEVNSSGAVAIPNSWTNEIPGFVDAFGVDFGKALMKTTGKKTSSGKDMYVWQDYVAGTDPTDKDDTFTAIISIVDGKAVVSYSPELDEEEKTRRKYTVYGKRSLADDEWLIVTEGQESDFKFFKVTVEMR